MTDDAMTRLRAADPLGGRLPDPLPRPPVAARERRRRRPLLWANAALAATVLLHFADHYRQDPSFTPRTAEVGVGGALIVALTLMSLLTATRGHRRAALVSLVTGPWIAVSVIVSHLPPQWSALSDSYPAAGADALSYVAVAAVAAAGLAVGHVARRHSPG